MGKLRNCIAFDAMNFTWCFHLRHCIVPFVLRFRFGFFGFLGRDILDRLLLILVGGRDEFDHLAGARSDHSLNRDVRSIGSQNRVELDLYFSCGREIGIERFKRALSVRNAMDFGYFPRNLAADRNDEFVEGVNRLRSTAMNRLAYFFDLSLPYREPPAEECLWGL